MEEWLVYNFATQMYSSTTILELDPFSNGITCKNTGTSNVIFQRDVLQPGESKAIGGNRAEILRARVQVSFADPDPLPVGYVQVNQATVTEKFYMPWEKVKNPC